MVYDLQKLENPKFFHCFGDEDYMGVIAKIAKGCHRKVFPTRAMQRLLLCVVADFEDMKKSWKKILHLRARRVSASKE